MNKKEEGMIKKCKMLNDELKNERHEESQYNPSSCRCIMSIRYVLETGMEMKV